MQKLSKEVETKLAAADEMHRANMFEIGFAKAAQAHGLDEKEYLQVREIAIKLASEYDKPPAEKNIPVDTSPTPESKIKPDYTKVPKPVEQKKSQSGRLATAAPKKPHDGGGTNV